MPAPRHTLNEKLMLLEQADSLLAAGLSRTEAAARLGLSVPTLCRWLEAREVGGAAALEPGKSTGRPPCIKLQPEEALALRRAFVTSNLNWRTGSMTTAARTLARDDGSPLRPETREAILRERASKHILPVAIRRACRGASGDEAVAMFRGPRRRLLKTTYVPGLLRMVREPDNSLRRLFPGERQSWDDASVNFCVTVPWPWGGDPCSERWGVKVGRFQLLAGIDDSTDFFVGWSYVIRMKGSYRAEDVVASVGHAWRFGYKPEQVMFEGGAWQSQRSLEMLRLANVQLQDAKGRPHKKLIEGAWNRLWTPLSMYADGQIGRKQGEMEKENTWLRRCQDGSADPRAHFPSLEVALSAIQRGIAYCNEERVESKDYGKWIPRAMHEEGIAARPRPVLEESIEHLALRERAIRTIRRGMLQVTALSPIGRDIAYRFASERLIPHEGAPVWVNCDPFISPVTAHVTLARRWKDIPAGTVLDAFCPCINAAPMVMEAEANRWSIEFADAMTIAQKVKRLSNSAVRRELRSLTADGARVIGNSTVSAANIQAAFPSIAAADGPAADPLARPDPEQAAADAAKTDFDDLERQAGVLAG